MFIILYHFHKQFIGGLSVAHPSVSFFVWSDEGGAGLSAAITGELGGGKSDLDDGWSAALPCDGCPEGDVTCGSGGVTGGGAVGKSGLGDD